MTVDQITSPEPQDSLEHTHDSSSETNTKSGKRLKLSIAGAAVALLAVGGGVAVMGLNSPEPRLQNAYDSCQAIGTKGMMFVNVSDGGKAIWVDTKASYNDIDGAACVLAGLSTPDYIIKQIDQTSALMGVQDATADGFEYSWSYHPDSGMNMTIIDTQFDS